MTIRPLEKQFEPKKVADIRKLQKKYERLRMTLKGESAGYMISGINRSLETGILIGALSLAFSFLDMFMHDLVIIHAKENDLDGDHPERTPLLFSGQRLLPFEKNMEKFIQDGLIEEKDGKEILLIYRNIGIPLHHVLARHIGRYSKPMIIGGDSLLDRFLIRRIRDVHQVEDMIEDYATQCLNLIVTFIQKYHPVYETLI